MCEDEGDKDEEFEEAEAHTAPSYAAQVMVYRKIPIIGRTSIRSRTRVYHVLILCISMLVARVGSSTIFSSLQ